MELKLNKHSVIAFDLDDTLYKEVNFVRSAFSAIARKISPMHWEELFQTMFSQFKAGKDVFFFLQNHYGIPKESLISEYRSHIPTLGITDIPKRLTCRIRECGGKVGVITDGRVMTQTHKLDALGISDLLDFKIISEATGHDKTAAHNFLLLEHLFPNHEFTYIADNPAKDFYHPKRLGWFTIGILDSGDHIHKQDIQGENPDHLPGNWVTDISDLTFNPSTGL